MPVGGNTLGGRHVVITGGTGALGSAVASRLLAAGASCHVTWVAEREVERYLLKGHVSLHRVDCADERQVVEFYHDLPSIWASVHIVGGFSMGPIESITTRDFEAMWRMNTLTCFLCSREAVRRMRVGDPPGGRIVNVGARPAVAAVGGMVAYSASKAGVVSITQSLAEEVRQEGILVNAVLPSIMDTPANRSGMPGADFAVWPKVEEVAEAIAFLAGPENTLTTGALLPVYGRA